MTSKKKDERTELVSANHRFDGQNRAHEANYTPRNKQNHPERRTNIHTKSNQRKICRNSISCDGTSTRDKEKKEKHNKL